METTLVGKILKPFGIKGELKVEVMTDFVEQRFAIGETVLINNKEYEIASVRPHKGNLLVSFVGHQDINLVEDWRNLDVRIPKQERHDLPDNEFYFDELIGLDVYVEGEKVGVVIDMYDMPAQPLMSIRLENGEEAFVPCVKQFIEKVDLEKENIVVRWMEGLW